MTEIHFVDVGYGNMQIIMLPDGKVIVYDCNVTVDNERDVLSYLQKTIGRRKIDVFINSHRDADHMRGIKKIHRNHPIQTIWDAGVVGTTTTSREYREYMDLRRTIGGRAIEARKRWRYGTAVLRCMNAAWEDYSDPNDQSIVLRVEDKGSSAILTGDTSYRPWKEKILPFYGSDRLSTSILLAAHHGSISFFDDPADEKRYYTVHMLRIAPAMTLVSVGPNTHGLPDGKAMELYAKYSSGSSKGNKVYTTEDMGTMRLVLKDDGGWTISTKL